MKKVFTFPLFKCLHPDIGVRIGQYMSVRNKLISGEEDAKFLGEEHEWLVQYCKKKLTEKHYDYFIFGHRHLPLEIKLQENSMYVNLGDWIQHFTYGVFDERTLHLKKIKT
jgi:UDP-2,3-diacylglucosamine hydrolase